MNKKKKSVFDEAIRILTQAVDSPPCPFACPQCDMLRSAISVLEASNGLPDGLLEEWADKDSPYKKFAKALLNARRLAQKGEGE